MGNKLDATRISLEKGFTGVSDPTSTLSAITKGVNDIKTWQQEREAAANKLKTDTANSVRESTIEANKKLTGNKSVDTVILKALESTKNKLYTNEKLVQKNAKSPTDNLIFRQNAKQSYEILSQNLNDYDKNFQESLKRAKGYVGEDGNKIGGGAFEAGIQRVQTTLGNPNLYEIVSNDDGTMDISFYKTKINTTLNTRELVLDKEGNPIVDPTMSGMAATTFMKGKNQQSDRLYLSDEITKALAKGSALDTAYESIITQEGYTGVVLDDMRNSPGIKKLLYDYAKNATATSERRLSILADNMPVGKEQKVLMPNDVENFKGDIKETVSYEYFDIDTGLVDTGIYNKYVIAKLDPMSGLFINEETDDAKLASERIAVSSLYSGLKRKITGRDTKPRPQQSTPTSIVQQKLLENATTIIGGINKSYGGDAEKDIAFAVATLQNSSNYKFQKQEDIMDGNKKIGLSVTVVNDEGITRSDNVLFKVKDDSGEYINATADEYGTQMYELFKSEGMPSYKKAKQNYVKNTPYLEKLNEEASRRYVPKITENVTTEALDPVTLTTSLNDNNDSPLSFMQEALEAIESSSYDIYDDEIINLSNSIEKSLTASQTKYGKNVDVSVIPDTSKELITINYGDGKTQVIDLTQDNLEGGKLISDIKNKLDIVFKNSFPAREELTKQVTVQGGETTTTRRTIAQIMTEDKVDMKEATKIFNAQK